MVPLAQVAQLEDAVALEAASCGFVTSTLKRVVPSKPLLYPAVPFIVLAIDTLNDLSVVPYTGFQ